MGRMGGFMNKGTGSFTVWENTRLNSCMSVRSIAQEAWHDGYASAEQTPDYERGFIDGMQEQMKRSVEKEVRNMKGKLTEEWNVLQSIKMHTERKPLSKAELYLVYMKCTDASIPQPNWEEFARAIKQAHGIKE
jgi:hypothetical protein